MTRCDPSLRYWRSDAVADWIVLVSGYDPSVLKPLAAVELGAEMLVGAISMRITSLYALSHALTSADR